MKIRYTRIITEEYEADIPDFIPHDLDDDYLISQAEWEEHNWSDLLDRKENIINIKRIEEEEEY